MLVMINTESQLLKGKYLSNWDQTNGVCTTGTTPAMFFYPAHRKAAT